MQFITEIYSNCNPHPFSLKTSSPWPLTSVGVGRRSPTESLLAIKRREKSSHGTLVAGYVTPSPATVTNPVLTSTAILFTLWCQFLPQKKLF